MNAVYMVVGWFGADEWNERAFLKSEDANAYSAELWKTRKSIVNPGHICNEYQLCKFGVEKYEVH